MKLHTGLFMDGSIASKRERGRRTKRYHAWRNLKKAIARKQRAYNRQHRG